MKTGIIFFFGLVAVIGIAVSIFTESQTAPELVRESDKSGISIPGEDVSPTDQIKLNVPEGQATVAPTSAPKNLTPTKVMAPKMTIDKDKFYSATLKTSEGDITIELSADKTPITVNNFIYLAKKGFYDGTIFHRVIEGFMIQGGDPNGDGTGGPGYNIKDEEFTGEYTRGTVAMARTALPNSAGSQFFIIHKDSLSLPKDYTIFGKVTDGLEVVDAIAEAEVDESPSGEISKPVKPVKIEGIEIIEE